MSHGVNAKLNNIFGSHSIGDAKRKDMVDVKGGLTWRRKELRDSSYGNNYASNGSRMTYVDTYSITASSAETAAVSAMRAN